MLMRRHALPATRSRSVSAVEVGLVVIAFVTVAGVLVARQPGCARLASPFDAPLSTIRKAGSPSRSPSSSLPSPRIAAAFTTSKRPDLFRRAFHSFRARCLDCDTFVHAWFAVDDGSDAAQLRVMHAVSGDVTWLTKPLGARGHVSSLNRILDAVVKDYDYLVFLEDDFFFIKDAAYVSRALDIFARNASIGQVVFNERYSLTDTDEEAAGHVGGVPIVDPNTNTTLYLLHEYVGAPGSPAWKAYFAAHPGFGSVHWPHFSLNSGVWRVSAVRSVGKFEDREAFEFFYGLRYMGAGYMTAFFPGRYSIHLGKPLPNARIKGDVLQRMYRRHGLALAAGEAVSAYDLNGVIR